MRKLLKSLLPQRVREFRYLPHGEPVPRGWELSESVGDLCHHNEYSVLISRPRRSWL